MPRAILNDVVLADSPTTVVVEGNHYFPPESIVWDRLESSATRTVCPWKGLASYHDALFDDGVVQDVAWTYKRPSPFARRIRGHVAFGPYVRIEASPTDPPPALRRGVLTRVRERSASSSGSRCVHMSVVLAVAVGTLALIVGTRGRRATREGRRRRYELLRRQHRGRVVAAFMGRPVSQPRPAVLPRCDQCGAVLDDVEGLRQHAHAHAS